MLNSEERKKLTVVAAASTQTFHFLLPVMEHNKRAINTSCDIFACCVCEQCACYICLCIWWTKWHQKPQSHFKQTNCDLSNFVHWKEVKKRFGGQNCGQPQNKINCAKAENEWHSMGKGAKMGIIIIFNLKKKKRNLNLNSRRIKNLSSNYTKYMLYIDIPASTH